jgi:ubiquinone/menaquinone biosynthesis C-methylase UbiE
MANQTPQWHSTNSAYVLDNAGKGAQERFAALADAFDLGTMRHLKDRGIAQGWRCLEVGGGGGSIATWLSARVGPSGRPCQGRVAGSLAK